MRPSPDILQRARSLTRTLRPWIIVPSALALITAACGEFPTSVSASTRGNFRGGGTTTAPARLSLALVGQWRRTLVFVDDFGGTNVIATLWSFRADGTFTRSIVTSNVNSGIGDSRSIAGRWEIDGNIVTLVFHGGFDSQRVTFFFSGADLILGGAEYVRVS
jgi:hypothetical protein